MTDNNQKERFSIAYLRAVCAKAKIRFEWFENDDDGIDCEIRKDICGYTVKFEIQLKSTTEKSDSISNSFHDINLDNFTYKLNKKNYDDLIRKSPCLRFLMLLVLPENRDEWLSQDSKKLTMRKCMYYKLLSGEPPSNNSDSVSVKINKSDICSVENINKLMSDYIKGLFV